MPTSAPAPGWQHVPLEFQETALGAVRVQTVHVGRWWFGWCLDFPSRVMLKRDAGRDCELTCSSSKMSTWHQDWNMRSSDSVLGSCQGTEVWPSSRGVRAPRVQPLTGSLRPCRAGRPGRWRLAFRRQMISFHKDGLRFLRYLRGEGLAQKSKWFPSSCTETFSDPISPHSTRSLFPCVVSAPSLEINEGDAINPLTRRGKQSHKR